MATCRKCNRPRVNGKCACASVVRGWERAEKRKPRAEREKAGKPVAHQSHHGMDHEWCDSCGSLVRNGKCVATTCGKKVS